MTADTSATPIRFIRLARFCAVSGYTEKAIRRKIEEGIWMPGREYVRAPDGCICVDIEGYNRWAASDRIPASSR